MAASVAFVAEVSRARLLVGCDAADGSMGVDVLFGSCVDIIRVDLWTAWPPAVLGQCWVCFLRLAVSTTPPWPKYVVVYSRTRPAW